MQREFLLESLILSEFPLHPELLNVKVSHLEYLVLQVHQLLLRFVHLPLSTLQLKLLVGYLRMGSLGSELNY